MSNKLFDAISKLKKDGSGVPQGSDVSASPANTGSDTAGSTSSGSGFINTIGRLLANLFYLATIIGIIGGIIYYKKTKYEEKCNGPIEFNTLMHKVFGTLDPPEQDLCSSSGFTANENSGVDNSKENNKNTSGKAGIDILPNDVLPIVFGDKLAILKKEKEVFNISNPVFNYNNAMDICQSQFNGRLATEEEVEQSAEKGSHWCVPSWSANKQLLYPIQQSEYRQSSCAQSISNDELDKLNNVNSIVVGKNKNYSNVADLPDFGINCYGFKPDAEQLMKLNNLPRPTEAPETTEPPVQNIPDLFREEDLFT